jgi:nicotinamide-nucleotide amidase
MDDEVQLVAALADALRARGQRLATAESCTGGGVAAACTDLAGSSDWFERGFVTYSNAAKTQMLGVPADLIAAHGAVSQAVAQAMAEGALGHAAAEHAVAITGVAGPGGGSPAKPVGTVWFGFAQRRPDGQTRVQTEHRRFDGDRAAVRAAARRFALQGVLNRCQSD